MLFGDGRQDSNGVSRRGLLKMLVRMAAFTPFVGQQRRQIQRISPKHSLRPPTPVPETKKFSDQDDALLQELEAANFRYFWDQTNPETGIVRDRCNVRTPD